MSSFTSVSRAPRLSDEVARQLTAAIRSGEFAPGAPLPSEKELAERFEVSRVVVREAMSRLKSDELIDTRQRLGAFVAAEPGRGLFRLEPDPAVKDLHDIFQLRVAVEGAAAGLAAVRASRKAWVKLSGAYRISQAGAPFHDTLDFAQAVVAAAPERCVWGSDWPHVSVEGPMFNTGALLDLLPLWVPEEVARNRILVDNPARLYRFATATAG